MAEPPRRGILDGIRVLDASQVVSGPLCAMLLGDLGADVVKVEPPEGDASRTLGDTFRGGESDYFLSLNRNKRGIVLDLKTPQGVETYKALAMRSDVVLENFRPGIADGLGVGYDTLAPHNAGLVYCAISGYREGSAHRDKPALDPIVQAMSGIMSLTGTPGTGPLKTGFPLADYVTPLHAVIGILAALLDRSRTGAGQRVDVAMLDATLFSTIPREGYYFARDEAPPRLGNSHFQIVPANTYATADGRQVMVIAHNGKYWRILANAIGDPDLARDPRFASERARIAAREAVDARLAAAFAKDTLEGWVRRLDAAGALYAPVREYAEVLEDPEVRRDMLVGAEHPRAGHVVGLRNPVSYSRASTHVRRPSPLLGEHTDEVLREIDREPEGNVGKGRP